jgi:DHA1 family multidrug resistance protein-like MFS transporter
LYGFFGVFRLVYVEIRGFSPQSFALTYIALGLGFIFGAILMSTVGEWSYRRHTRIAQENGLKNPPPEARLSLAYFGSILTPISLFIFAFTASDLRTSGHPLFLHHVLS